jgi:hypothetical protein
VQIHLYRREHCNLCELAAALLRDAGVDAEERHLEDDAGWEQRYGWRIPVLARSDTGAELDWPFDAHKLARFLA